MKAGLVVCAPDVTHGPLALLSGTFEQRIHKAASLGYQGIELMVRDPASLDWPWLKKVLGGEGLEVPQIVTGEVFAADGLCLVHGDALVRQQGQERARTIIDFAQHLGAMVNLGRFRGQLKGLGPVSDPWGVALEQLRPVFAYAQKKEVRLTLEPLNRYECDFIRTAAEARRVIEACGDHHVGIMLDLFHMNIEETSFEAAFRTAGDRLWHVHIADSNRRYPGSGHLDIRAAFGTLREIGYGGYVSAELLPLPDPDTAAIKTIQMLQSLLDES